MCALMKESAVHRMFRHGFPPVANELTVIIGDYDIEFVLSVWRLARDCLDVQLHNVLKCVIKSQFLCFLFK